MYSDFGLVKKKRHLKISPLESCDCNLLTFLTFHGRQLLSGKSVSSTNQKVGGLILGSSTLNFEVSLGNILNL